MKKIIFLIVLFIATALAITATPNATCRIDNSPMVATGTTLRRAGKIVYQMQCTARGHFDWIEDETITNMQSQSGVYCPIDNYPTIRTNNIKFEDGKLLAEYKCPSNHLTWR